MSNARMSCTLLTIKFDVSVRFHLHLPRPVHDTGTAFARLLVVELNCPTNQSAVED